MTRVNTDAPAENFSWDLSKGQVESTTHLEDDKGTGHAAVIRQFKFSVNPETFKQHKPTKQELFNHHYKQIEILLWQDDLKIMDSVAPQLMFNKKNSHYTIIVGAVARHGRVFHDKPNTLKELV